MLSVVILGLCAPSHTQWYLLSRALVGTVNEYLKPEKSNIIIYFYLNYSNLGKNGDLHQFPIKHAHFYEYQFVSWCTILEKQKINPCTHIQMSPPLDFESNNCFLFFSLIQWVINTMPYREYHLHNINSQQY